MKARSFLIISFVWHEYSSFGAGTSVPVFGYLPLIPLTLASRVSEVGVMGCEG